MLNIHMAQLLAPFDPVKRRSSVESTQSTAFVCPSAMWIHWSGEALIPFEAGNGLIMPLRWGKKIRFTLVAISWNYF